MKFIEPKRKNHVKVDWQISDSTKDIISYYAEYTGYSEEQVVDIFLQNLRDDENFKSWVMSKRNNKRMVSRIYHTAISETEVNENEEISTEE